VKTPAKITIFLLRISLGWIMLYAGLTKVIDPSWSAEGFLTNAKTFSSFYAWFATSSNIVWVNFVNEWGLTLLGASLILGIFVRYSAPLGAVVMLLYYFPQLNGYRLGENSIIIDLHIIYALVLVLLALTGAGKYYGFDKRFYK
jgi:thiosulfate dehydrogenase (quinone) large subunit